jgi:NDP-sugar pyrophosphorylase family protein
MIIMAFNRRFVEGRENFGMFYTDNFVHLNFPAPRASHGEHPDAMTVALFRQAAPPNCGVVRLDLSGRFISFEEKLAQRVANLVNTGIDFCRRSIFDFLPAEGFAGFGSDIMADLAGRIWGIR